jgi:hypothetical protein
MRDPASRRTADPAASRSQSGRNKDRKAQELAMEEALPGLQNGITCSAAKMQVRPQIRHSLNGPARQPPRKIHLLLINQFDRK